MEEVYRDKAIDYLMSLGRLGPEQFLVTCSQGVLLENYAAPSSRIKLARVETISEPDEEALLVDMGHRQAEALLEARVIPLEKRDINSSERMIFVGRSPDNDIVVLNKLVSKLHAYFCQIPGTTVVQVVDMNSTNGTFINGQRLLPSVKQRLEDADVVSFGPETRLEYFSPNGFYKLLQKLG